MKKTEFLKGSDIILNLKKIQIYSADGYSSSTCSCPAFFYFENTKHGLVEDPDMAGEIQVLKTEKRKGCYILKVKFKKDDTGEDF